MHNELRPSTRFRPGADPAAVPLRDGPADEQAEIVYRVSSKIRKIDTLGAATKETIVLLKERRAVLIAAAVTGKIDVGGNS